MQLTLYNTLSRSKETFIPLDTGNIKMYVCGPTVYDRAHLGNARSVVVYDVLFRLLQTLYGNEHVTYIRNITDVDDKINAAAKSRAISIQALTQEVTGWFHADMAALNNLSPTQEPKATQHIAQMISMIEKLIKNESAYQAENHVLFSVEHCTAKAAQDAYYYGKLSGRIQEDLNSGTRVKVESYKRNPNDFVLWKPADGKDDISSVFDSPWGKGRPGWHIECSAMSCEYLGHDFDIHGGGADLMFPHHENEIAQACGAYPESKFARYWVHNGFLTVNGEKMSKSLGNFVTVYDLLNKHIKGEVIRYALLKTRYREPLDFSDKLMEDAKKELDSLYRKVAIGNVQDASDEVLNALCDDLNLPKAISILHTLEGEALKQAGYMLGILQQSPKAWFKGAANPEDAEITALINARVAAKKTKNWAEADRIRAVLKDKNIILEDRPDGSTDWRRQ